MDRVFISELNGTMLTVSKLFCVLIYIVSTNNIRSIYNSNALSNQLQKNTAIYITKHKATTYCHNELQVENTTYIF